MLDRATAIAHGVSGNPVNIESIIHFPADTAFLSTSIGHPSLSAQNLTFKRRLDSLEKSVPLNYNEYVQSYIDIYLSRGEQMGKMLGLSKYYFPIFEKALKEAGLPDEIKFVTVIESALNPHAVSRSGAVGPWQFMYTTAKGYGLVMDNYVDERKDPVKASYAAAHYFVDAYKRIGDWLLTIAAFNCGTGAVTRAIEKSGGIADFWKVRSFLPRETQNYVPAFIATVYAMNYYRSHGIQSKAADFNVLTDVIEVNRHVSIASIAKAADFDLKELLLLNPSYKKQIINGSIQSPKSLVIPGVNNNAFASLYDVLNGGTNTNASVIAASMKEAFAELPKTNPVYHRVLPGQTLTSIANKYGAEVQDLKVWNRLKTSTLVPGQNIRVSAASKPYAEPNESSSMSYVVKVGDTLSGIADKFSGMTVSKIKALNGLSKSVISPGMKLIISQL
ncbi:membrane-bound lytic murein transglycosylase D [Daejeonella lutea]|uniref:Membrane-bound lytic murein transglycosylase D n=2 Tax=Daejeonella lutea TaxID=572036 RepID=A0A1T5E7U4_9SPHI|nr:membrane-bound lytic murein transglycosylase D [Daejeonella lutea]